MKVTAGELWLTIGSILGVGLLITLILVFAPEMWTTMTDYIKSFFTSNASHGPAGGFIINTPRL